ncbi:hypothetical protein KC571_02645 [candidate division WWE3 bacterium]|uniref:Uncharacterized protein n=1 Tax=candidate division WWE3 bacterium TaxID=2053526 RepID=A0A955RQC7_UNCKA|nr:hypothetical protein [candidate division WWE3 bacterium]
MKFLFIGENNSKTYLKIEEILDRLGHSILKFEFNQSDMFGQFDELRDQAIASDGIIIDASGLSPLIEFQMGYLLQIDKQIFFSHEAKSSVPASLATSKSKKLFIQEYSDTSELEAHLEAFLKKLESNLDAKLFMIIPPQMNKYLEWVASHTDRSKSDVVRNAVLSVADTDEDYQSFLKRTK